MEPTAATRAASCLLAARQDRIALAKLPDDLMPASLGEAYAVQAAFEKSTSSAGVGYKIGASSQQAQAFLGVSEPFAGRVFETGLLDGRAELAASDYLFRLVEPEFAFRLGADLPARAGGYDDGAIAEAVADLYPALEIVNSAFGMNWTKVGGAGLIADNGAHGALVLGPACTTWRELDLLGHAVTLAVNGQAAGSGQGANAFGGPLKALAWLVNHLCARGRGIAAGEVVTTGVVTDIAYLEVGDRARADFGSLGAVEVLFAG